MDLLGEIWQATFTVKRLNSLKLLGLSHFRTSVLAVRVLTGLMNLALEPKQDSTGLVMLVICLSQTPELDVENIDQSVEFEVFEARNRYNRSFKSSCDHEFGVVFYDKLGRRSFVSPVGSVYVPGYSYEERGHKKGISTIQVTLEGAPPSWADKYQIVYGGNKTITDFVQYSTNNAFIEPRTNLDDVTTNTPLEDLPPGKIYVSLNMLQHSTLSYVKEFGARGEDGGLSMYKFSEGDKLRIISYEEDGQRKYPENVVFDVLEFRYIEGRAGTNNNPSFLWSYGDDSADGNDAQYTGEFAVLKDNLDATNFSHAYIATDSDFWDRNVIFEIFSPKNSTSIDTQVYQEIGPIFPVNKSSSGTTSFSANPISIYEGDVFFRPHAVNVNIITGTSGITDLLSVDENVTDNKNDLNSNFKVRTLESSRPTDLFPSDMEGDRSTKR